MRKIMVELEVPEDEFAPCQECKCYEEFYFGWGRCCIFEKKIEHNKRCNECKQAEVKDGNK